MKKFLKIATCLVVVFMVFNMISQVVYADSLLETIFGKGGGFFKNYFTNDSKNSSGEAQKIINPIKNSGIIDAIKTIGYLIFFIAGSIIGLKYMISGVEGKVAAKEGLIGYCLGAVMFYLADQVFTFFFKVFTGGISNATSYTSLEGTIWSTFTSVISVAIVLVVVIYGLKFMWSSAEDRGRLKQGMVPMLIGAVLILCTTQILKFVVNISQSTIGNDTKYDLTYVRYEEINNEIEIPDCF